jgi:glycosyltransferase involved in cell wall biosynthesis
LDSAIALLGRVGSEKAILINSVRLRRCPGVVRKYLDPRFPIRVEEGGHFPDFHGVRGERTRISIAMATYNGERFLEEQLRSLNQQVRLPDEAVVCDDGSTDRTQEILAEFAKSAAFPVRLVINDHRLGWRENFLKAASTCTSDYIAFCDQDDVWLPEKLSVISRHLDASPCVLLQHAYRLIDENGKVISNDIMYSRAGREALWRLNFGFSLVFHRSLLKYSNLWEFSFDYVGNDRMGHDNWVAFLSSIVGGSLAIDDVLVHYRRHNQNTVVLVYPVTPVSVIRNLRAILSRFCRQSVEFQKKHEEMVAGIQRFIKAAKARQRIIELILPQVSEEQARSLRGHWQYYREFEDYQAQRLFAYLPQSRIERFQAAFRTFRQGRYQAQGRQGAREAIADLIYGVAN